MKRNLIALTTCSLMLVTTLSMGFSQPPEKNSKLKEALDTAIDDERHALAFYEARRR